MFHIYPGLDDSWCNKIFKVCVKVMLKIDRVRLYNVAMAFSRTGQMAAQARAGVAGFGTEFGVPSAVVFSIDTNNILSIK